MIIKEVAKVGTNPTAFTLLILIVASSIVFAIDIATTDLAIGTIINTTTMSTTTDQPTGNVTNTKYLQVTNHLLFEDLLFTIVNGTVINNSNNTLNSVEINVQFYDEKGELITSKSETARSVILAPGENSSFNVRSDLGEEIVHGYNVMPGGDIGEA